MLLGVFAFQCPGQDIRVYAFLEKGRDTENAEFLKCVTADIDNMRTLLQNNIHAPGLVIVSGFPEPREKPPTASGLLLILSKISYFSSEQGVR